MTPEQREELKPCPFCGGPVTLERAMRIGEMGARDWWGIKCRNTMNLGGTCAIEQIPSGSPEAAIERWNRRAQVDALTVPQWQPIETAPQDGYMLVHEDGAIRAKLRFNGEWQHVAYPAIIGQWGDAIVGEDARRMLPAGYRLELRDGCCENPTHWKPMDAAPTIPAIPGTKEGA